jgi:predicted transcriptional regulator
MSVPNELTQAAESAKKSGPQPMTARQLLGWYGFARRGTNQVADIRKDLKKLGVKTEPDFLGVWMDAPILLQSSKEDKPEAGKGPAKEASVVVVPVAQKPETAEVSPSHRISRLKAANTKPVNVKPTDSLDIAVTLMMKHDFSQIPVMTSEREVKGIVSWRSIGNLLAMGKACTAVKDCMEAHHEVRDSVSMFDVIRLLSQRECILIRNGAQMITGIVTAADISEQFHTLSEPFLLLGDIENSLRYLIEKSFSVEDLKAARDPGDATRIIESAADLTFGEYVRLLENPDNWKKLKLQLDRGIVVKSLSDVRLIRNDVMHFDPDGISPEQIDQLRQFSAFLDKMQRLLK